MAATLKSISEFTIVEDTAAADVPRATPAQGAAYDAPTLTPRYGTPEPAEDSGASSAPAAVAKDDLADPAPDFDALVTVPPFEADQLFDDEATDDPEPVSEPVASGEGFATSTPDEPALAIVDSSRSHEVSAAGRSYPEPDGGEEPAFIGGDPSTRFVAESLEEIARSIRAGEVVLPRVDPAAGQPAVLAAVLAALLAPR